MDLEDFRKLHATGTKLPRLVMESEQMHRGFVKFIREHMASQQRLHLDLIIQFNIPRYMHLFNILDAEYTTYTMISGTLYRWDDEKSWSLYWTKLTSTTVRLFFAPKEATIDEVLYSING
jgi:hypothetical protein